MKMCQAPQLLKKATAMCKSKTGVLAGRLLVLAALHRRRMTSVAVISHRIHTLIVADRKEKTQAAIHGGDMAANLSHQLALFGCPDWTLHPIFSDDESCCTEECDNEDDGDVLLDACHDDEDFDEPSVMDVSRMNREVEGLEFNMEEEIDQAADMFIRRFRQQLNKSL